MGKSSTLLIFPQIVINFSYFSSNFTYFLPNFGPPGVAHPGRPWLRHWLRRTKACSSNSRNPGRCHCSIKWHNHATSFPDNVNMHSVNPCKQLPVWSIKLAIQLTLALLSGRKCSSIYTRPVANENKLSAFWTQSRHLGGIVVVPVKTCRYTWYASRNRLLRLLTWPLTNSHIKWFAITLWSNRKTKWIIDNKYWIQKKQKTKSNNNNNNKEKEKNYVLQFSSYYYTST